MNQQLPVTQEKRTPATIAVGMKAMMAETLPKHIDPDGFARTVQTALQVQPELLDCAPRSLMIACMKAATDGLILDGREAAMIVRSVNVGTKQAAKWEKQATYQPMVQGLMKLARNSGEIVSIVAHVVYSNDRFQYVLGDDERIEHLPAPLSEKSGEPVAAYAIVKLKDGTAVREVMRASAILNIAAQGKNAFQYDPGQGKNFAEWWRKTVIRRITKYIPRSSDAVGRFKEAAEAIDGDYDFQDAPPPPPATKKRGGAAAALGSPNRQPDPQHDDTPPHDPQTGEVLNHDDYSQREDDDI